MENIKDFIESGILELYVLGIASPEEVDIVEKMANKHDEIKLEIDLITASIESFGKTITHTPNQTIKPFLLATIDYSERLKKGEPETFPLELNENSKIEDYSKWINRVDMVLPLDFKDFYAKIIGHSKKAITAIIWIKEMAPQEVHDNEFEKFLILEGTCDIIVENKIHHLKPGDYFSIPLHFDHHVKVTSQIPCKAILQRVAA